MTPQEMKDAIDGINRAFNEMTTEVKAVRADAGKLARIEAAIADLETKLARPSSGSEQRDTKSKTSPEARKAFGTYLRKGSERMAPEEVKEMILADDTTGGYLATSEFVDEIIKDVVEISNVRPLVRVRTTSKRSVKVPKRTGTFAAVWIADTGTKTETTGLAYGLEEIPNHELYALAIVSNADLEDADFDLEAVLREEFSEQFAFAEGQACVSGGGVGKPEGFMTNTSVSADVTGDANNITYTGLVNVSHNLKPTYFKNAKYVLNLATVGKIRLMLDSQNRPLWTPMQVGAPAQILGLPYELLNDMDATAANKYPVACGDFKRAYTLVDRKQIEIQRDPYSQNTKGAVQFLARKRVGGQVVLPAAIRKLQIHT